MPPSQTRRVKTALTITFMITATSWVPLNSSYAADKLRMGVNGLGVITAATRFDPAQLKASFPDFRWKPEKRHSDSGFEQVLHASKRGQHWFSIVSDGRGRIASVEVHTRKIRNWLGPQIGELFDPLYKNLQLENCRSGQELMSGEVGCRATETNQISYVFSGSWDGPDGELPPSAILASWTLRHIIWRPTRFAGKPVETSGPSFDCAKASGSIEQLICKDADLSKLDRKLTVIFSSSLTTVSDEDRQRLIAVQRGRIKGRNDCWKSTSTRSCVLENYRSRIAELKAKAG